MSRRPPGSSSSGGPAITAAAASQQRRSRSTAPTRSSTSQARNEVDTLVRPRAKSATRTGQHGALTYSASHSDAAAAGSASSRTANTGARSSKSPARHFAPVPVPTRRGTWSATGQRLLLPAAAPPASASSNLSGSNLSVHLPRTHTDNGIPVLLAAPSAGHSSARSSHSRLPPSFAGAAAAAASSHARAGLSTAVASVSLTGKTGSGSSHGTSFIPVRVSNGARSSPMIAPVSLRSKSPARTGSSASAGTSPSRLSRSHVADSAQLADVEATAAMMRASVSAPVSTSGAAGQRPSSSTGRSAGAPVVSVSLSHSGPPASLNLSAPAPARRRATHASHHRRGSSTVQDEEDDPTLPIEVRRARAVAWLLHAVERKEEPLYCPSWFTAVDPAAMIGLASVRNAYLELVHAFSLRAQALAYIDDVYDAWLEDKTRVKARSKINMMRVLQRKPPLPTPAVATQRRPSFSQLPAVKRAAAAASLANLPQPVRDRETAAAVGLPISVPASGGPKVATISLTSGPNGTAAPTAGPLSAPGSATAMLASFEALLLATTKPTASSATAISVESNGRSARAATAPPARSLSASPQLRSSSPPVVAVSLNTGPASSAAALLASGRLNAIPLSATSRNIETPAQSHLSTGERSNSIDAAADAADDAVPAASATPADDITTLHRFKMLLSFHPVLLKHSVYTSSRSSKLVALPPKESEMRLLDNRLYHSWKADRPPEQNRKYVRLREIVDVRPGRSRKLINAEPAGTSNSNDSREDKQADIIDDCCFHVLSLPMSAREAAAAASAGAPLQLPVFDELNLQADSAEQRDLWIRGLKLLAAEQAVAGKQHR